MSTNDDNNEKEPEKNVEVAIEPEERQIPVYTHKTAIERHNLFKHMEILDEARYYYNARFGKEQTMPEKYKNDPLLMNITPEELAESMALLDIKWNEKMLYWIAQLYYLMP